MGRQQGVVAAAGLAQAVIVSRDVGPLAVESQGNHRAVVALRTDGGQVVNLGAAEADFGAGDGGGAGADKPPTADAVERAAVDADSRAGRRGRALDPEV